MSKIHKKLTVKGGLGESRNIIDFTSFEFHNKLTPKARSTVHQDITGAWVSQ